MFSGIFELLRMTMLCREYLHHIEQNILKEKHQLSCLKYLVICEEKYKFTPDDFKAATRAQRMARTVPRVALMPSVYH
jgi:hypothetical protein